MAKRSTRGNSRSGTDDASEANAQLDARLPSFRTEMLGWNWSNSIGGLFQTNTTALKTVSPVDRAEIGGFPIADATTVDQAVQGARGAFSFWSREPWKKRADLLRSVAGKLEERKYDLAVSLMLEGGFSRADAMAEVAETIALARTYADVLEQDEGYEREVARPERGEQTTESLRPLGVFAAVSPFCCALSLSFKMIGAAIVTGNTVIYKPSLAACMTGAILVDALIAGGVPGGVINLIFGGKPAGELLVKHGDIDGIVFGGSERVGTSILREASAARNPRAIVLHTGGKNAAYVTASADLDAAADGIVRSAFGMQGQTCVATSKVYVQAGVKDAFLEKLLARAGAVRVGPPTEAGIGMGPLINENAMMMFTATMMEAMEAGYVLTGGQRIGEAALERGCYVPPTIVEGIPADHRINRDELLLPVLSVLTFDDLGQAIADGNGSGRAVAAVCYAREEADLALFFERARATALHANRTPASSGAMVGGPPGRHYLAQFMRAHSRTTPISQGSKPRRGKDG